MKFDFELMVKTRDEHEIDIRHRFKLQCEPGCDSHCTCDNCHEVSDILVGFEIGWKAALKACGVDCE